MVAYCSQAFSNITAGACMVLGLKFAGTANEGAFCCLVCGTDIRLINISFNL